ncbi:uncharacterized protein PGTG_20031 [Puccinia graminis f. sp. tritici CRL 75-36-700-3]|uniref:Uncharacterized protein n=1 Tax=Puccinia graminis f. sp. tritici (strain CRL 75-36-700-3 / race SCCL) TaxID=418459 RepID=E3LBW2_PUCGT|nr:uncharacterized protein PGTG_20031 [Puccinia graminis f. sp. tritici CRL 75-36-700-3]EFP94037.1 hypothetical protein PGTG_20031 [Puccinia graminis f. sp. tritici CRL 75-36-700-3]
MSTQEEFRMEQLAIILKNQAKISEIEDSIQCMQETLNMLLKQMKISQSFPTDSPEVLKEEIVEIFQNEAQVKDWDSYSHIREAKIEYDRKETQDVEELCPLSDLENAIPQEPNLELQQSKTYQKFPPLHNKYSNNLWKDERLLKLVRSVFSEEWYYYEIKGNHQLLQDLPGGGASNLDFILTDVGTEAFLNEGPWESRYGQLGYKLRISIYNEDKKGLRWAEKKIPGYKPFSRGRKSVFGPMQEGTQSNN